MKRSCMEHHTSLDAFRVDMNRRQSLGKLIGAVAAAAGVTTLASCGGENSGSSPTSSALTYTPEMAGPFPIPQSERGLETVVAEPYFQVSTLGLQLEGASFDRAGNLLFVEIAEGRIFKLTPDKVLSTVFPKNSFGSAGTAIHKDGRIFVAGLGNLRDTGSIFAINADGTGFAPIIPASAGYLPDDLVFDANGGFYFTDFKGDPSNSSGGVYYVSPDFTTITPVIKDLAIANGVCLSPDGTVLWATEFGTGLLHRVELSGPGTVAAFSQAIPYRFNGYAPDSMRADSDGNVYVAMYSQGRFLVFNKNGIPIGQILIPGRETGHNMFSTSLGFVPGTNEILLITSDADSGEGAWIFRASGFAKGATLYSHK